MAAANTTLKVNVDTSDAQRSLSALQSKFETLKTAILGVGFATAIAQANNYANAIKDVSTASDLSVASVAALSKAFTTNGGTAEGAQNAILKFADSVGGAIGGSDALQKSFAKAGITLSDLQNLTQQQLFDKYIAGLAKMGSTAERVKNQLDVLGKSSKGVDFGGGVQGALGGVSARDAAAIQAGADAAENMKRQFGNLTQALLNVTKPLNDIASGMNTTVREFESLLKMLVAIGSAFLIFGKVLPAVQAGLNAIAAASVASGGAMTALGTVVIGVWASFKGFFLNLARAVGILPSAYGGFTSLAFALGALLKGFLRLAGVVGIIIAVAEAVDFLSQKILGFSPIDWLINKFVALKKVAMEFFGIKPDASDAEKKAAEDRVKSLEDQKKAMDEAASKAEEFKERQRKLALEITKVGDAYAYNNDQQLQAIALETRLIGKTEEEQQLLRGLADIYKTADEQIKGLLDTRKQWAQGTEEQKASVGLIDQQVERIKRLRDQQQKDFVEYTNIQQGKKMMEEDRIRQLENLTKAIEQQTQRTQALGQAQLAIIAKSQEVDFAKTLAGLSPFQQQIAQIQEDARKAALEAGRAYAGAFEEGGDGLTPERARELTDGLAKIADGYKAIADQQIANLEQSRTFAEGWKTAFEQYADSAFNASEQARTVFTTATKGMEDAIVNFAKTGKFEWRGFLGSVVEELLRSNIRQLIAQSFGGVGSGGSGGTNILSSLWSGAKSLFGFANGGMIPNNAPVLVGERGPEIISGMGGRSVTPNEALGTTVTYNINAVDASSFRSMIAQDPEFLFAVTEQGRRRQPGQRR